MEKIYLEKHCSNGTGGRFEMPYPETPVLHDSSPPFSTAFLLASLSSSHSGCCERLESYLSKPDLYINRGGFNAGGRKGDINPGFLGYY